MSAQQPCPNARHTFVLASTLRKLLVGLGISIMRCVDVPELSDAVQTEVKRRWPLVTTENLGELTDFVGFREDFFRIFGFGVAGVDYDAEVNPQSIEPLG